MKTTLMDWLEFTNFWMDHCTTNGLSVVALDRENCRVAGVFLVRDLLRTLPGFDEKYQNEEARLSPLMGLCWQLDAKAMEGEFIYFDSQTV